MGQIFRLPDAHEGFYLARRVLRSPDADQHMVDAAVEVLRESMDWGDQDLVRHFDQMKRCAAPKPQPRNTVTPAQFDRIMQRAPIRNPSRGVSMAAFAIPLAVLFGLCAAVLIEGQWSAANYRAIYGVTK